MVFRVRAATMLAQIERSILTLYKAKRIFYNPQGLVFSVPAKLGSICSGHLRRNTHTHNVRIIYLDRSPILGLLINELTSSRCYRTFLSFRNRAKKAVT
jgi:hypothetical protein